MAPNGETGKLDDLPANRSAGQGSAMSPCFTRGTLIATPRGEIPAEHLRAGDRVVTRDNGIQEIRWAARNALGAAQLLLNAHLQPVLIAAGALGNGLPERDLLVSPNHRVLVAGDRSLLHFDDPEVLVAAKHLVGTPGVQAVTSVGLTYVHFLFDRHEVVLSNGAWTESFQPTDFSLKGLGNAQRSEILELFPALHPAANGGGIGPARRVLTRDEAAHLKG
ncbi:Hint domain-containing protein [Fuscovulum blasticum]|uniref:Hint domain-containing protein n=1 Tax=Fuscovulum blasticum TaxID=1075 RepID=UPI000D3E2F39|nr:type I secretion protein [Fuscovulum blasticum]